LCKIVQKTSSFCEGFLCRIKLWFVPGLPGNGGGQPPESRAGETPPLELCGNTLADRFTGPHHYSPLFWFRNFIHVPDLFRLTLCTVEVTGQPSANQLCRCPPPRSLPAEGVGRAVPLPTHDTTGHGCRPSPRMTLVYLTNTPPWAMEGPCPCPPVRTFLHGPWVPSSAPGGSPLLPSPPPFPPSLPPPFHAHPPLPPPRRCALHSLI